jgi:hypothetical protein
LEFLAAFAEVLAASPFGQWAGRSEWAYPIANVVHVLGLVLLLGGIGLVDLRLLGAFGRLDAAALSDALVPVAIAGLLLMLASGGIMFAADAPAMAAAPTFRWKLLLVGLALLNALAFRLTLGRGSRGAGGAVPPLARIMAAASLFLWTAAAVLGRMIAYT